MPEVILVVGQDWASGDELPAADLPVMPRIGEKIGISGKVMSVKDVKHDLTQDDQGKAVVRVRVLASPSETRTLLG